MEALKQILPLLLTLSLAGLVMTVGLKSGHGDLIYVLRRPSLLLKAILAVEVIPPLAAAALVWMLPLEPAVKAGIMLMAISPVPPLVPGKQLKIGGRKEYAYGVYVAMALLTIVADTCGRHDTLGGACAQESNTVRYALDKRHMHSCRDNFLCACLHDGRLQVRVERVDAQAADTTLPATPSSNPDPFPS